MYADKLREDEKGYTCECGVYNKYPAYVFAHWRDKLTHTCECERTYAIQNGVATETTKKG